MKVKICTPLYKDGCEHPRMRESIKRLLDEYPTWTWQSCVGPHIWRNRNNLITGNADAFWQWDADICSDDPVSVARGIINRGKEIVGAAYEMRRDDGRRSYCAAVVDKGHVSIGTTGFHPVDRTGGGCLFVVRDVFDNIDKPYFRHEFYGDDQTPEDWGFCINAKRHVYRIWLDCDNVVTHLL